MPKRPEWWNQVNRLYEDLGSYSAVAEYLARRDIAHVSHVAVWKAHVKMSFEKKDQLRRARLGRPSRLRKQHWTEAVGERNLQNIIDWFDANPDRSAAECAKALGLSVGTVYSHIKSIEKEL